MNAENNLGGGGLDVCLWVGTRPTENLGQEATNGGRIPPAPPPPHLNVTLDQQSPFHHAFVLDIDLIKVGVA